MGSTVVARRDHVNKKSTALVFDHPPVFLSSSKRDSFYTVIARLSWVHCNETDPFRLSIVCPGLQTCPNRASTPESCEPFREFCVRVFRSKAIDTASADFTRRLPPVRFGMCMLFCLQLTISVVSQIKLSRYRSFIGFLVQSTCQTFQDCGKHANRKVLQIM